MAKYFITWGFPHDRKKKPVLLFGPEKSREEQQLAFQHACMSKTNPDFQRIDFLSSVRGVQKKKHFEKGPYKPRVEPPVEPVEPVEPPVEPVEPVEPPVEPQS